MLCLGKSLSKRSEKIDLDLMAYKIIIALRNFSVGKSLEKKKKEAEALARVARSGALLCVKYGNITLARNILEYARTVFGNIGGRRKHDIVWKLECAFCVILLSRGDFARAEQCLRRLANFEDNEESLCTAEIYSRHVLASYLVAVACSAQEKFQEAKIWATSSIRRVKHLVERARREDESSRRLDAAFSSKRRATNRSAVERLHDTVLGPCLYLLAHLSMRSGRHDEAVSCFRLCAERGFRGSHVKARNGVVASLAAANELREAMMECRTYANLTSTRDGLSSALLNFATLHAEAGRHEDCRNILRHLLKSSEDRETSKTSAATSCDSRQNLPLVRPGAVPCLDRSEILHRIGDSSLRVGDPQSAIDAFVEISDSSSSVQAEHALRKCLFAKLQSGLYEGAVMSSSSILSASEGQRDSAHPGKRVSALLYGADALVSLDRAQEALPLLDEANEIVDMQRRRAASSSSPPPPSSSSTPVSERRGKRSRDALDDNGVSQSDAHIKAKRRVRERVDVIAKNNRALAMLCVGRDKEAINALHALTRRGCPKLLSRSMQEQIHFNYALALWRCDQRTAACAHWLGARGFIAAIPDANPGGGGNDDGASAMAAVKSSRGNYQRISILLEQQQLALSMEQARRKSRTRSNRSLVESHVRTASRTFASTDLAIENELTEREVANTRAFDVENRVPLDQILRLDVTVLSHWRLMQEDAELREGLMRIEKIASRGAA
eukprot:g4765.t1